MLAAKPKPLPTHLLVPAGGLHTPFPSIATLRFCPPPPLTLTSRFRKIVGAQVRQRLVTVLASNPNSSGGDSIAEGKSDKIRQSDAPQGPPFLTIVAGFLVLFLICWGFGSIIMWLFGLIVNLLPPKKV